MARIIGIDYGTKRTGIAVTDPLQIIASPLTTIATGELQTFLEEYMKLEEVEAIVFGMPSHADGNPTYVTPLVIGFMKKFGTLHPELRIESIDEAYTSVRAKESLIQSGTKKKKRREKGLLDKVSASLILQDFLENEKGTS